ncbi:MAG TPA: alpha-N-acetylglucosaminidase TIM-barrel domain-containing protein [Candidatus Hydrogenedentes bacterium]|mgnify:CR=1 FL=1|nr:alpha-N-acetylglucosaminidase TIM-barrel domain-containing protein [Candidatus Hydrogenedentota bacterium]HPG66173.1 alpha-N-acetylglucosaminidase TIM-barrel domain-containing protein [Candidatus Hydrogenedentota bacterium]
MMLWAVVTAVGLLGVTAPVADGAAAQALINRVISERAGAFTCEIIARDGDRDVFEIESGEGRVTLRGSNGVAIASALNWYLKHYCRASFSLCGSQLELPDPLPPVSPKIRIVTPFAYRYCFNYCCFSYSMAWWDWPDWERAIDWMALEGINMPLAVTGQEAVWRAVGAALGLTAEDLADFFVGTAYLPFGWMGCIDGWGGPLTSDWIDRHRDLESRILERARALGMTPVLQGFTGHAPRALQRVFPEAAFRELPSWCGFPGTLFVDPSDPLFQRVGQLFVEEQTRLFGTDHLYASDTFIEMSPPSEDPAFLDAMGKAVYAGMQAADPEAVWVMQGWLFVNNPEFWKPPQAKALLGSVPDDRMVVLDLFCEQRPAWKLTEAFYGKPWVWCIIQSFGNQVSLHGGLPQIGEGLPTAVASSDRGRLVGAGCIMEGLGYNPPVYDLMGDLLWRPETPDWEAWPAEYAARRYGKALEQAEVAWRTLLATAYRVPGQVGSVICARPALAPKIRRAGPGCPYNSNDLVEAWRLLLECADELGEVDAYRYDVVHVGRQVLVNHAASVHDEVVGAFANGDREGVKKGAEAFLNTMRDTDALLATRPEFLLGRWLEAAKAWGNTDAERQHLEWNARNQITLWGPADSVLHDYAAKQWAGLISGFYMPRWQRFFDALDGVLADGVEPDANGFDREIQEWEAAWTHGTEVYAAVPVGSSVEVAQRLWAAYRDALVIAQEKSLTTGKPVSCSAYLPAYPPERANDGWRQDTDSYWAVDVGMDPECWWQVDLESPTRVGRVVVVLYYGDERSYEFTVQASVDGETWALVADYRGKPQRATRAGVTCRFAPRMARYLRVQVTGNSANTGRHLVEVMAFDEQGAQR